MYPHFHAKQIEFYVFADWNISMILEKGDFSVNISFVS